MKITSLTNDMVKFYTRIMSSKKDRDKDKVFIVEGEHLVSEAVKAGIVKELVISNDELDHYNVDKKVYVTDEIMRKICDTVNPQGIIALCSQYEVNTLERLERILILDDVSDPGNLGTIIRTCDAFGFDGIVMSKQAVDVYNPKVVRATQGAIFRVRIVRTDLMEYIHYLRGNKVTIYGTSLNGENLTNIDQSPKMAFIMGNEARGVNEKLLATTDKNLFIEMSGQSESLNVAVASAIIMYNFRK